MSSPILKTENRKIQRIALPLPTRVEVQVHKDVSWNEVTRLSDVSAFGAGFPLSRPVKRGRLMLLTIPMPRQLRCFDYGEAQYRVWGLVRRCIPISQPTDEHKFIVGVAFVGKNAPDSYHSDPSTIYEISHREEAGLWHVTQNAPGKDENDIPVDMRRQTRFSIPEAFRVEILDADGNVETSEVTVTENLSLAGASVFTSLNAQAGSFVRLTCERNGITIISIIRARRQGMDGMTRLHLEFVDRFFPLEGIV